MNNFIKRFFTEYILYIFIILFSAQSANFLDNKIFIILVFFYSTLLYFRKHNYIDQPILILFSLWILINAVAYLRFGNIPNVKFITFLSVSARMLLPYFTVKLFGRNFFDTIEKFIFFLTLISLPIFILQLLNPSVFYAAAPALNMFAVEEQQVFGGWYVGFYMFNGWAPERNSGFMWEPGAFAFIAIIGMIIRLSKNRMTFDKYIAVYILAVLSTFSTMGYTVLFIVLLSAFLRTKSIIVYILLIPVYLVITFTNVLPLDFMLPKIELYFESIDRVGRSSDLAGGMLRLNRFGILAFAFEESLKWPFGYGVLEATPSYQLYRESIQGPNTYAQILLRWGWVGIVLFAFAVFKFIKRAFPHIRLITRITLFIAFLAVVFSYSLLNNSILLAILYFPFISKGNLFENK